MVHLLGILLEAPFATAPLTIVLGGLMFGSKPRPLQILGTCVRRLGPMILLQFMLRGLLLSTFFLSWLIPTHMAFVNEVILLERGKSWKVWPRCHDLAQGRSGELFTQWLAQFCFGSLFVLAFWVASSQVTSVFEGELTWARPELDLVVNAWVITALWISVAFFGIVRFLTYIDHRIRLEGWEVEIRLRAVGRTMREELEAW